MLTVTLESVVKRSENFLTSTVDDEILMMSVDKGVYYGLDTIGSRIWNLIGEPILISDLCKKLTERYEVDSEQCEQDVLAFLNELLNENMIHVVTKSTE